MRTRFVVSTAVVDLMLLAGAVGVASLIAFDDPFPWVAQGFRVLPFLFIIFTSALLASLATIGMSGAGVPRPTFGRGVAIVGETLVGTAVGVVLARPYFSRSLLAWTFVLWSVAVLAHRAWRRRRPWTERIALVTAEKELADDLAEVPHAELVTIIDPRTDGPIDLLPPGTTLAVDLRAVLTEKVAQWVSSCDLAGYPVRPLASVYEEHTGRIPLVHLAEGWEIRAPLARTVPYLGGKRLFDLLAVVVTTPIWLVLGLAVAAAVKISSPGPVIFAQRRVGKDRQPFVMYKFRTMRTDAEDNGPRFAQPDDRRFIRGGAFLRRSRLDEIPQLWNVLKGEMSLVGPRAEQLPFVRQFEKRIPFYNLRHLVRPGLTGWAQVNYGYADDAADTVEKLAYDLYYVRHMSPILDLEILWKSVWTVLTGAGAR